VEHDGYRGKRPCSKAAGGQIIGLSDAEAGQVIKAVQPIFAAYKKNMVSKGFKEADVDGWLAYIKERIAYWKAEEKKRGSHLLSYSNSQSIHC